MASSLFEARSVFVSSTFRDMHGERDLIRDVVLTELSDYAEQCATDIGFVDLRWGVRTSEILSEEEKERYVLKVCLDTIDETRPFIIVLLGDRYGWMPKSEMLSDVASEKNFQIKEARSVTALEIEYALTAGDSDKMRHCFFYFRDQLPYERMNNEQRKTYSDAFDNSKSVILLESLKNKIEHDYSDKVRHYSATWDEAKGRIIDFGGLEKLIVEDMKTALDYELSQRPPTSVSQKQLYEIEIFFEKKRRGFYGRKKELLNLMDFAKNSMGIMALIGESGTGKSAIMAELYGELAKNRDIFLLPFCCGMSSSLARPEDLLALWISMLIEENGSNHISERLARENPSFTELVDTLEDLLFHCADNKRIVMLIDAADQFGTSERAQSLSYLPVALPHNVVVLISLTHCNIERELYSRNATNLQLNWLEKPDIVGIVERTFLLSYKTIAKTVLNSIATKSGADNPLILTAIVQTLLTLDEDDFEEANRRYLGTGLKDDVIIDRMLENAVADIPSEPEAVYPKLLQKMSVRIGGNKAKTILGLLAYSEYGLRLVDMDAIFETADLPFTNADFFFVIHRFRNQFLQDSNQAWRFHHNFVRDSIRRSTDHSICLKLLADHSANADSADTFALGSAFYHLMRAGFGNKAVALIKKVTRERVENLNVIVNDAAGMILNAEYSAEALDFFVDLYKLQDFTSDKSLLPFITATLELLREQANTKLLLEVSRLLDSVYCLDRFVKNEDILAVKYLTERANMFSATGDINTAYNITKFALYMGEKIFGNNFFPIVYTQPLDLQFGCQYPRYLHGAIKHNLDIRAMQKMLLDIDDILIKCSELKVIANEQRGVPTSVTLSILHNYDSSFLSPQSSNADDDTFYYKVMKCRLSIVILVIQMELTNQDYESAAIIYSNFKEWSDFMDRQQAEDDADIKRYLGKIFSLGASVYRNLNGVEEKANEAYQQSIRYYTENYRLRSGRTQLQLLLDTATDYAAFLDEQGREEDMRMLNEKINPYLTIMANRYSAKEPI